MGSLCLAPGRGSCCQNTMLAPPPPSRCSNNGGRGATRDNLLPPSHWTKFNRNINKSSNSSLPSFLTFSQKYVYQITFIFFLSFILSCNAKEIFTNSMGHQPDLIDIYSASWGPTDDGRTVDGPRNATMRAIVRGVNEGRHGLGNIYVWASGDGGEDDDCNCDGYAASMWTISINSAINTGENAHYDESCCCLWRRGGLAPRTIIVATPDQVLCVS